ncbi:hypothetical protein D3C87_1920450 [compost metagenome]
MHFRQVFKQGFGQVIHQLFIQAIERDQNIGLGDSGNRLTLPWVGIGFNIKTEPGIGDGVDVGQLFIGDVEDA